MPKNAVAQSGAGNKRASAEKVPAIQKISRLYEPRDFTMIPNKPLRDKRLCLEARGLLCSILSLPLDWSFNMAWAQREFSVGRDKLYRLIAELKDAGYIRYVRPRDSKGKLLEASYYVVGDPRSFEHQHHTGHDPLPENTDMDSDPLPEKPDMAEPTSGFSGRILSKEDSTKQTDSQKALPRDLKTDGGQEGEAKWRRILELYREKGLWAPFGRWGPKMHEPGCLVPPHMVKLFDSDPNSFRAEKAKKARPAGNGYAKDSNGLSQVGTLNLPGTSHD
jgi:hypothetical protein